MRECRRARLPAGIPVTSGAASGARIIASAASESRIERAAESAMGGTDGLLVFQLPGHKGASEPSADDARTSSTGRLPAGAFRAPSWVCPGYSPSS